MEGRVNICRSSAAAELRPGSGECWQRHGRKRVTDDVTESRDSHVCRVTWTPTRRDGQRRRRGTWAEEGAVSGAGATPAPVAYADAESTPMNARTRTEDGVVSVSVTEMERCTDRCPTRSRCLPLSESIINRLSSDACSFQSSARVPCRAASRRPTSPLDGAAAALSIRSRPRPRIPLSEKRC